MKNRDIVLFGLPLTAVFLAAAFAFFLYRQISTFEKTYLEDAENNVALEARLVSGVAAPLLTKGKITEAIRFCGEFNSDTLRVTLIDPEGRVTADSLEKPEVFGSHRNREEVASALSGTPKSVVRYSESLGKWMMYHALPIPTEQGTYVLRTAVSTDRVQNRIDLMRLNMFWALIFGAELVLVLVIYILRKVRKPLISLQKSIGDVASGKLETPIEIPENGIVRELALGVSEMTAQLRGRLAEVTAERNERTVIFNTMTGGVLIFASDGSLLRANRAAAELFDFDLNEGRFQLSRCRIPDLLAFANETFRSGTPFEHEFTLPGKTGDRSLFIKGLSLEEAGERRLFLTVTELTSLRKLEAFRSDFVANVSHEIKTPLTCIVGAAEALEDDPPAARRAVLLDMLKKQSKRLNSLVQDILSLASIEKQQRNPDREFTSVALDSVLLNAAGLCRQRAADAGFRIEITENPPVEIQGDSGLLEQALVNLIENAVKYSGGKLISLSLKKENASAVLEVRDDGTGIPPEHRERIFERFYRVDKSRSRELGGTGLGLAIVKHIARLHKGRAELADSERGCLFRIVLPLEK